MGKGAGVVRCSISTSIQGGLEVLPMVSCLKGGFYIVLLLLMLVTAFTCFRFELAISDTW